MVASIDKKVWNEFDKSNQVRLEIRYQFPNFPEESLEEEIDILKNHMDEIVKQYDSMQIEGYGREDNNCLVYADLTIEQLKIITRNDLVRRVSTVNPVYSGL